MSGASDLSDIYGREVGRCTATLVRVLGDIDLAEEAVAEAFAIAARRWPTEGLPPNPGGWITTTARNWAIDHLRRESTRKERYRAAEHLYPSDGAGTPGAVEMTEAGDLDVVADDQLRLMFLCCHPSLGPDAQVALTLRLLGGLATPEIARAFLVPESTMAQRIVRAKRKIRDNSIPYRIPAPDRLADRLPPILAVVYLIFTEGHTASAGTELTRVDLSDEAIRLARLLVELLPDEQEPRGLLALLLLTESRRPARTGPDGSLVRLPDQDRSRWDRQLIAEGHDLVRGCLVAGRPGPYQLQAAIAAVHADTERAVDTDWGQIVALYDHLLALQPGDIVALNRAIAVGELAGPQEGLEALDGLALDRYHLYHAGRAELLLRLGRADEALDAYRLASTLTANAVELRHYEACISNLAPPT